MSSRERWIMYPLLFFAILLSLKNAAVTPHPLKCQQLECESLVLRSSDGQALATLLPAGDGAALRIYGPVDEFADDRPKVDPLKPPVLRQVVELGANETGGYATLFGPEKTPVLKLGHHESLRFAGLIATDKEGTPFSAELNAKTADVWGPLIDLDAGEEKKEEAREDDGEGDAKSEESKSEVATDESEASDSEVGDEEASDGESDEDENDEVAN